MNKATSGENRLVSNRLGALLKRWRENYYLSLLLANAARPLHTSLRYLALQIQRKIRKNAVTIRLPNGRKLTLGKDTGVAMSSLLFWHGIDGHEPDTSRTLRFLFEHAKTFVDVGANCGLYSVLGPLWNPNLQVVAFEPVPGIFESLQKNVRLNRLESSVGCQQIALSDQSGTASLFLPPGDGLDLETTGTLVTESWQARKGSPSFEVQAMRFDDYEKEHPLHLDLVKIDVEDFEANVLEGMKATIMRDRPFVVCEILPRSHRNERTKNIVEALNYQAYWITPMGYIRVSNFDFERVSSTDFLLSPVSTVDTVISDLSVLCELKGQLDVNRAKE
jgi:FkbM family methyltransferase